MGKNKTKSRSGSSAGGGPSAYEKDAIKYNQEVLKEAIHKLRSLSEPELPLEFRRYDLRYDQAIHMDSYYAYCAHVLLSPARKTRRSYSLMQEVRESAVIKSGAMNRTPRRIDDNPSDIHSTRYALKFDEGFARIFELQLNNFSDRYQEVVMRSGRDQIIDEYQSCELMRLACRLRCSFNVHLGLPGFAGMTSERLNLKLDEFDEFFRLEYESSQMLSDGLRSWTICLDMGRGLQSKISSFDGGHALLAQLETLDSKPGREVGKALHNVNDQIFELEDEYVNATQWTEHSGLASNGVVDSFRDTFSALKRQITAICKKLGVGTRVIEAISDQVQDILEAAQASNSALAVYAEEAFRDARRAESQRLRETYVQAVRDAASSAQRRMLPRAPQGDLRVVVPPHGSMGASPAESTGAHEELSRTTREYHQEEWRLLAVYRVALLRRELHVWCSHQPDRLRTLR